MNWKPIAEHDGSQTTYLGWSKADGIVAFQYVEDAYCTGFEGGHIPNWEFKPTHFCEYKEP